MNFIVGPLKCSTTHIVQKVVGFYHMLLSKWTFATCPCHWCFLDLLSISPMP
jgi:hypothetical protein